MNNIKVFVGTVLLLAACNSNNGPSLDSTHERGLLLNQSIESDNVTRNYHLYLPDTPAGASIVLLLHGNGGSSDQLLGLTGLKAPFKLWMDIALQNNLVLVVPDGSVGPNDKQGWNDCRNDAPTNPDSDDVHFIGDLVELVQSRYTSNYSKIDVVGVSNGALMAMRLADEKPELLRALAIVVASKPVNSECVDSVLPLPALIMNGTSDPILPYNGGQIKSDRGEVFSTGDTINYWVDRNQTELMPVETFMEDLDQSDNSSVTEYTYANGSNSAVVVHYEVTSGGHTEPSIAERYSSVYKLIVGNQNGDIEAAEKIWNFFKSL